MNARELTDLAIGVYGAMQKHDEFLKLMELCLEKPHETVLEIGSGRGGTLWAWSHLPNNKTVISVDLPGGAFGGGLTDDDKERIENWMDPKKNTFLCAMDSHDSETLKEIEDTLGNLRYGPMQLLPPSPQIIDILFIDGDHTYEGVKKDFEMYSAFVRVGGLIVFHDICDHSESNPACQVDKFWNYIREEHKHHEFISEPKTWGGIGVIEW